MGFVHVLSLCGLKSVFLHVHCHITLVLHAAFFLIHFKGILAGRSDFSFLYLAARQKNLGKH